MGSAHLKPWNSLSHLPDSTVLVLGYDAAGKTTLLFQFRLGEIEYTMPKIGCTLETLRYQNLTIHSWDACSHHHNKDFLKTYYANVVAIIYVIDTVDMYYMEFACEYLHMMLEEDALRDAKLLIFANKQDLPGAKSVSEMTELLKLHSIRGRNWHIQPTCAVTKEGVYEGLEWLTRSLSR